MTEKEYSIRKDDITAFDSSSTVLIGTKVYLIKRHFTGNRDFSQAVFSAVANEATRNNQSVEAG